MLKRLYRMFLTQTYWRIRLGALGGRSVLFKPLIVANPGRISIGERTQIRDFARLEVIHRPHLGWDASLRIGNRVLIEQGVHIVCQGDVTIGDDVAITAFCAIVDTYHPHDPPDMPPPIGRRLPTEQTSVTIGAGTIIGMHSVVLPNVHIGRGCVIGAGSIVRQDIPDYSMAAGSPARVISRFDRQARTWIRLDVTTSDSNPAAVAPSPEERK
jgi:acetyltransferase-like isoleucine patch superfamily enzyme